MSARPNRGFTLIEVLVVTAIVGTLSAVVLANLHNIRTTSQDSFRLQSMAKLRDALELYYLDHGAYPTTINPGEGETYDTGYGGTLFIPSNRVGECWANSNPETGEIDPSQDIPGFVPKYMPKWPKDPKLDCAGVTHSWFYASDGANYKLITHIENWDSLDRRLDAVIDPVWDSGPDVCAIDGTQAMHVGYWTPGASCWSI